MHPNFQKFSYLKSSNAEYIDEQFARYLEDPSSVDESWRYFFDGLELGTEFATVMGEPLENGHAAPAAPAAATPTSKLDLSTEAKVAELIVAYRRFGRLAASIDPLHPAPAQNPLLSLSQFGLSEADLDQTFSAAKFVGGMPPSKLRDIIARLREIYSGSIAVENSYISDPAVREWIQNQLESASGRAPLSSEEKKRIFKRLVESESLERFLGARYVAQKRFSIEGGEALIPALDQMIETGAELGAKEIVIGMAHRGRLNVLTHVMGKKPEYLFTEFEGTYKIDPSLGEGDVKYHKGYSADQTTRTGKKVHLSLAFNPSHLEVVDPVVEGMARAKQTLLGDSERTQVIPILIHGDAAFAGQGVVYETLNLSQLEGYATGGTIHVVVNNQVGFTTSPKDARSTPYCTDLAKMLESPIFHVNGDDAEAVWKVAKLCTEFRQKFKRDVFIDLVSYRKHGHNEGDEPSFTQPILYKEIKAHPSPREVYGQALTNSGIFKAGEAQQVVDEVMGSLGEAQARIKAEPYQPVIQTLSGRWAGLKAADEAQMLSDESKTAVPAKTLLEIATRLNTVPSGFHPHSKLTRFLEMRLKAVQDGKGIDWGNGEALAYGSLLIEGHPVRLSGQDAERGTFTHRHSVLNDFETGEPYTPLNHLKEGQAHYSVHNSHLSETGVMGFEFGYSLTDPNALVLWEGQFGDFANGAQIIIDQFLCSSESKWQRMSGLVLLLPHGFEGQGPEHSSARLERFLQLSGRGNWSVANFTTPAQFFHALRRQVKRPFRKPLIVMTPKSLLRHPHAISTLEEFTQAGFQEVIDDPILGQQPKTAKRVVLCSGKVYYDLLADRAERKITDTAIIRVEQLYPWPAKKLVKILDSYSHVKDWVWAQEEPRNMGSWSFVLQQETGGRTLRYAGREIGAAPAVGSPKLHEKQQKALLDQAFGGSGENRP